MISQKTNLIEKCAVVGVWTKSHQASLYIRRALSALQHRGQESSGMSVYTTDGKFKTYKGMGFVTQVLTDENIRSFGQNRVGIGHNRYGTSGSSSFENAQPLETKNQKYHLSIAHNGNIPDIKEIRAQLSNGKKIDSDTALMAALLVEKRTSYVTWEETFSQVLPEFMGAYSLAVLTEDGSVFGIRDPYGIRPLCLGRLPDGWIFASESVALDVVGGEFIRDIMPGEIVKINHDGEFSSSFFGIPKKSQYCIFEYIYFARPDSFMNGRRVRMGREISGRFLGERIKQRKIKADVVVPVYDSGYPAAKGVAEALRIPMVDAITTSHYVGRTFIQPGQENRVRAVNGKHNIVPDDILGRNVVVVDDSAVRLTTSTILARQIKEAGAKQVTMAFASPPVVNQCDMGVDMRSKKELPASRFENKPLEIIEKNVAKMIQVEETIYLPIEETAKAMNGKKEDFYYYPFGGPHPIRGKQPAFPKKKRKINDKVTLCVFISNRGTFLQDIIDGVTNSDIDARICSVLSNNDNVYGLTRAKNSHIDTKVIPYRGKLSDKAKRNLYEEELSRYIDEVMPDVILLSGFQLVLGDTFLIHMQKREIAVINHHPALLTETEEDMVQTSRGRIPVLRGVNAWKDAYDKKLPVSGITVHQILPQGTFDVGPIIMKAEVKRRDDDTFESFKSRMDEQEHLLIPSAIKRVIHVIKNGIDISRGEFPW